MRLFSEPQYLLASKTDEDPDAGITQIDYEEQTAGYQAAYSRLAASESPEIDPVAYVANPQQFVGERLVAFSKTQQKATTLIAAADRQVVGPFLQALAGAGYNL